MYVQVGHTYVQAEIIGWIYVCPSYQYTHRVGHTYAGHTCVRSNNPSTDISGLCLYFIDLYPL